MRKWRWVAAGATVALIVGALVLASVDHPAVAAPLLLLNVVVVARLFGAAPALFAAGLGAAAYSYFFLPPDGFGLESPDDWIAFITFVVTAVVAGELASRAERRAAEAQAGRREIERLYQELQAAFERASEAEAARRNEALKAALARRADAQPANAADGDQGGRHGPHSIGRAPRARAVDRGTARTAGDHQRGIGSSRSLHRGTVDIRSAATDCTRPNWEP